MPRQSANRKGPFVCIFPSLIVNRGKVRQKVLRTVTGQIEQSGAELIGVILNDNGKKKSLFGFKRKAKTDFGKYYASKRKSASEK